MRMNTTGLLKLWSLTAALAVLLAAMAAPAAAEPEFRGPKACKKCHIKQYKSWEDTKMAQAFELLKPGERADAKKAAGLDPAKDYSADAKCVGCHVTGNGKPGGYGSGGDDTVLQGVACEMCHGGGGESGWPRSCIPTTTSTSRWPISSRWALLPSLRSNSVGSATMTRARSSRTSTLRNARHRVLTSTSS